MSLLRGLAKHFTSLSICFLIHKMEVIIRVVIIIKVVLIIIRVVVHKVVINLKSGYKGIFHKY